MGGLVFGPAQPLTTPQLHALSSKCKEALSDLFKDIRIEFCPRDKAMHGDIDILCAWEPAKVGESIGGFDGSKPGQPIVNPVLRELGQVICERLGGIKWVRRSCQINVAVPSVNEIQDGENEGSKAFHQIDVNLLPPESLDLAMLVMSYRSNIILLPRSINFLSPSLYLHPTRLYLRQPKFPGHPAVEVTLSTSALDICNWLGLDWAGYGEFGTEPEQYEWFANVSKDSHLGKVWTAALEGKEMPRTKKYGKPHQIRKTEGWDFFIKWLEENRADKFLKKDTADEQHPECGDSTGIEGESSNGPLGLDNFAIEALKYWSKVDAYEQAVRQRREAIERGKKRP